MKITIDDLLQDSSKEVNPIHQLIKEDLKKITKKPVQKSSFYDLVPQTELEKSINQVINSNSISQKRRENAILFEFDRKMQRINKIKSKTYRRMRRREKAKMKELESLEQNISEEELVEESEEISKEDESEEKESISEGGESEMIENEIQDTENKADFMAEKRAGEEECLEQEREIVLPGWGTWAGEGLEVVKSKFNVIKTYKEGVKREDTHLENVIINPNKPQLSDKLYSSIPPSMSKNTFNKKMNTSVSKECNSLRVFNMFVKSKNKETEINEEFIYEPEE